ncbi:RNA-directed DNA polymerase from mobile element jockey, partial [Araneus ventricosus]
MILMSGDCGGWPFEEKISRCTSPRPPSVTPRHVEAANNNNNVGDRTGISILKLLRHIGVDHEVHLQWIPSHVDIYGNEVADDLAKQGTAEPLCSVPSLTFDEIYSIRKNKDLKTWRVPPSHDWYKRSSPGGSIGLACDRADQTALSRFVSGHLRSCSFSHGNKVFPVCAKCGVASASPEHILSCLRLSRETFETDPLIVLGGSSRFLE